MFPVREQAPGLLPCATFSPHTVVMLQRGLEKQTKPLSGQGGPCGCAGGCSAAPDRAGRVSVQPELPAALGEAMVGNWASQRQDPASRGSGFGAGGTSRRVIQIKILGGD